MRRPVVASLLALGSAALVVACADGPRGAREPLAPSFNTAAALAASCDGSTIKNTLAGLYPTTTFKSVALPGFNQAEKDYREGRLAAAQQGYYALLADLVLRYKQNILQQPSGYASVADGVTFAVSALVICAEREQANLASLNLEQVIPAIAGSLFTPAPGGARPATYDPNYQLCPIVDVAATTTCATPSGRAAAVLPPGFVNRAALLLIEPAENVDHLFLATLGTIWSGRWRLHVANPAAQTGVVSGSVAVCAEEQQINPTTRFHAPRSMLELARAAESDGSVVRLPGSLVAVGALNCAHHHEGDEAAQVGAVGGPGDAYVVRRSWLALQSAGGAVGRWLAPQPLHAFDGGIGGTINRFASYFAATEQPNVYMRAEPLDQTVGRLRTATISPAMPLEVVASRTEYGVVVDPTTPAAPQCAWTSSHNRVKVVPLNTAQTRVRLEGSRSTGTAQVSVTCAGLMSVPAATITVVR